MVGKERGPPVVVPPGPNEVGEEVLHCQGHRGPDPFYHALHLDGEGGDQRVPMPAQERLDQPERAPLVRGVDLARGEHEEGKVVHQQVGFSPLAPFPLPLGAAPLPVDAWEADRGPPLALEACQAGVEVLCPLAVLDHKLPYLFQLPAALPPVLGGQGGAAEEAVLGHGGLGHLCGFTLA